VCCQCGSVGKLDGRTHRCEECGQDRDRDHNGAHNLARATLYYIEHDEWPPELTRPQNQNQ